MSPKDQIQELEKQLAALTEQRDGLVKRLAELESKQKEAKPSKSRQQAEAALALLKEHKVVTVDMLKPLNEKYPTDPIFYLRSLLHVQVFRVGKGSYSLEPPAPKPVPVPAEPVKEAVPQVQAQTATPEAVQAAA